MSGARRASGTGRAPDLTVTSWIPEDLAAALARVPELRRSYLVGGCVRDWLLGASIEDFDVEVFGVAYEELARALPAHGRVDLVGRSFGVIKLKTPAGNVFDFSLPRRDSKVAPGHKGFQIAFDPDITPAAAAARRDFTINAMMYDPRRGEVLDFFGGQEDLRRRLLRHTSAAFGEDPLRVLRGMQLAGRYGCEVAPDTAALCRHIRSGYGELAAERVRDEWFKWASRSRQPSAGLRFLEATGWLDHFPEIAALRGTAQDPEWHPEGDVFTHTAHCLDALVQMPEWQSAAPESRVVYSLAVLGHDFGKPMTTVTSRKDGRLRITSPGHEPAGGPLAEAFLARIHAPESVRRRVLPLVEHHLAHLQTPSDRFVRRLAKRLEPETIRSLAIVITADASGRPPRPPGPPAGLGALLARAEALALAASAPRPILLGRHLCDLGMQPGARMGTLLAAAYHAQIEGKFSTLDEAKQWLAAQGAGDGEPPTINHQTAAAVAAARLRDPQGSRNG